MTADQQNALNARQIHNDAVRRNMLGAAMLHPSPSNLASVLQDIAAADLVRKASGETIEVTDEMKMWSGQIPGTCGLTLQSGPSGKITVPDGNPSVPPKNA